MRSVHYFHLVVVVVVVVTEDNNLDLHLTNLMAFS